MLGTSRVLQHIPLGELGDRLAEVPTEHVVVAVCRTGSRSDRAAKGLRMSWILGVHVLPHVRPVLLEGLGSGLRVSVASLPIIEYLFNWRGIGQLALEAVGVHDAAGFIFSALVLAALFATLSAVADLSRPRGLFQTT